MCQPAASCPLPLFFDRCMMRRDWWPGPLGLGRVLGRSPGEARADSALACNIASVLHSAICSYRLNRHHSHAQEHEHAVYSCKKAYFRLTK